MNFKTILILGVCFFLWACPSSSNSKISGIMKTGVMSIGAETTGYILETKEGRYDLYLTPEQKEKATQLNGKRVIIEGKIFFIKGTERKGRKGVRVQKIGIE